jgi:hypothetical protein
MRRLSLRQLWSVALGLGACATGFLAAFAVHVQPTWGGASELSDSEAALVVGGTCHKFISASSCNGSAKCTITGGLQATSSAGVSTVSRPQCGIFSGVDCGTYAKYSKVCAS